MLAALLDPPPASVHEQQFRRQALLTIISISLLTSIFALVVGFPLHWTMGVQVGLAVLILKNVLFLMWIRAWPQHAPVIGTLYFAILAGTGVYKVAQAVLVEQVVNGLGIYSYWLPLAYVVAFLVFRASAALAASVSLLAALTVTVLAYIVMGSGGSDAERGHTVLLVQLLLSHVTFISFLALFSVLQGRYVSSIARAESEAQAAYLDVLTGLPNRRQLMLWLASALSRAEERQEPLSVILFDLDHFKLVNDTYGHEYGDVVLQRTGAAVRDTLRRGSLVGRWGGEEFLVVVPSTTVDEARTMAERLRLSIAGISDERHAVTVSLGVAQVRTGESLQGFLKRADEALYAAKHAGRNQVKAA
ncbi:GGDEF domain-containing protein [Deinococcus sonorensis]|uniref:GGDEF domain-containing protein n=2 Tax=Deinococcus sonorensis TaxID=309891 RepID=A0AAU7U6L7_9DEIO